MVTIVRMEVSRRKNILSITKAVKSELVTDESYANTEFLSTKRAQYEKKYRKKSVLWSILSNSSVFRTMSSLVAVSTAEFLVDAIINYQKDDMINCAISISSYVSIKYTEIFFLFMKYKERHPQRT